MKIIFLEFDGVLNSDCYFLKRNRNMRELNLFEIYPRNEEERLIQWHLYNLDLDNIDILKDIVIETRAKIVVISNWTKLKCFKGIRKELNKIGIPIIDCISEESTKEEGINNYLLTHEVDNYVIIDSKILENGNSDLLKHLIVTKLNDSGLMEEDANEVKKLLKKR